jgi:hypothetical protein
MARSVDTILASMDAEQASNTNLSSLNSTSQTAIFKNWKYITAVVSNYIEQLWDLYKKDLEDIVSTAAVGTAQWYKDRVLKFQYSASIPQVVAVNTSDFSINYPIIDPTLRIITRCSVITSGQRAVSVKVAKSEPPVALSAPELTSLNGYLNKISFAGVSYLATSLNSDKIYLKGTIYYDGQYQSVISANVIAAINAYLANIPFNGSFKLTSLVDSLQSVVGFNDVLIDDVAIRADATAFGSKTYLVQAKTTIMSFYPLTAGYVTQETTSGETFTDKLIFIPQ